MAEKTDEPKFPAARRGARPFVGPAGASSTARPVLRPVPPGNRPGVAPFAPPTVPDRGTLGTSRVAPPAVPAAAPVAPSFPSVPLLPRAAEVTPAIPPVSPKAPTPVVDRAIGSEVQASVPSRSIAELPVVPLDSSEALAPASDAQADAGIEMDLLESPLAAIDVTAAPIETAPMDVVANANASIGPVTSDSVAVDAFDAFDAVWGPPDTSDPPPPEAVAAPLDESSLGSGVDAQQLWADEITSAPENVKSVTPPTNHHVDVDVVETAWTASVSSDAGMPAWLADDSDTSSPTAATSEHVVGEDANGGEVDGAAAATMPPIAETPEPMVLDASGAPSAEESWPDPLLAEYAPYIPTPSSIQAIPPHLDPVFATPSVRLPEPLSQPIEIDATPVLEPAASMETAPSLALPPTDDASPAKDPIQTHGMRVSAALDRLAERVRSGEIDVSSVAPEAPDAAVLASVLAALLGGSSSR